MFLATRDEYGEYSAMFSMPMPTIDDALDSINCNPSGKGFVGAYVRYVTEYLNDNRRVVAIKLGETPLTDGGAILVLWLIVGNENPEEIARVYRVL